jgi:hypothetical protein
MNEPKTYTTAAAFRRALEVRPQDIAKREAVDEQDHYYRQNAS